MVTRTDAQPISPAAVRAAPAWLAALAIGLVALAPRATGLSDFFTIDESYHWIGRVERFSAALLTGDWAATNQTGHPGVTTMWLGALGHALATALGVENPGWAGGGAAYLALLRLPLAVANSLAVALGYLLLRRLVRPATALLGALMWALSPFLIAHGRLLHLDALLTSFMALSLLALLVALTGDRRPAVLRWFVLSGFFGGLAFLTKAPSLLLLPTVGLLLLAPTLPDAAKALSSQRAREGRGALRTLVALWSAVGGRYAVWLAVATVTVFALWPAMWVGPGEAVGSVLGEIRDNGGQPHHSGNYFLGEPVGVPDWRFYPAVVLWRTMPLTLLGLLALALFGAARAVRRGRDAAREAWWRGDGFALLALAGFALLFLVALSLQAKKLDRYLLPIFPALEILAAAGLVRALDWVGAALGGRGRRTRVTHVLPGAGEVSANAARRLPTIGLALAGALLALNLAYHPYYLSAFNPLLGGGAGAERVMLVGLGEGMEQVGAWLSTRPDLGRGDVLSWIPPTLAPFVPQSTLVRDLRPAYLGRPSSYAVLYVRSVQHKESAEAEAYVRQSPPLFALRMHGVTYATVHQLPRPFERPVGAVFGEALHLRGFTSALVGSTLVITPSWSVQAGRPGGVVSFVHVLAPDGRRVAQVDAPLDQGMFVEWQAGQQFDAPLPVPLPPDLPAGAYRVVMGLYTPSDGARLPVSGVPRLPDELAGPQAIELTALDLP
jgi:hypothetical protein